MTNYDLCIDLGSFYTTIYKKNCGVVLREPTLAIITTSGKNMKVVKMGSEAERMYGKISDDEVFVHPVVEGVIKNTLLTQRLLTYFLSKIAPYRFVKPAIRVIVLLPVGLKEEEYDEYRDVFHGIGFAKIDFVYSLVTSTLVDAPYFSLGKANMIVNIGAGKTEIGVVVNGKILSACSLGVGGNMIDKCIVEHLQQTKGYIVSQNTASKLKEEIGSLYETDTSSMEVFVQDSFASTQTSVVIASKDIIKPIYENYFKIIQTIQACYNQCSQEIASDIKNEGIILVGGASKMLGLEKFSKKVLNMSIFVMENAEVEPILGSEKLFSDVNLLQRVVEQN